MVIPIICRMPLKRWASTTLTGCRSSLPIYSFELVRLIRPWPDVPATSRLPEKFRLYPLPIPQVGIRLRALPGRAWLPNKLSVQDFWATYWDEYFSPVAGTDYYTPNPSSPEYLTEYRHGDTLANMGATGVSPAQALGFSFSDLASSNFTVPGTTNQTESISFVTALVGVTGSCNLLVSSNCGFQIFPGTIFKWTTTAGR